MAFSWPLTATIVISKWSEDNKPAFWYFYHLVLTLSKKNYRSGHGVIRGLYRIEAMSENVA